MNSAKGAYGIAWFDIEGFGTVLQQENFYQIRFDQADLHADLSEAGTPKVSIRMVTAVKLPKLGKIFAVLESGGGWGSFL